MSFNIEELKIKLGQYGTVIECSLFEEGSVLEIKVKNQTGKAVTYQNIETTYIKPYFKVVKSYFSEGFYKSAFHKL